MEEGKEREEQREIIKERERRKERKRKEREKEERRMLGLRQKNGKKITNLDEECTINLEYLSRTGS